MHIFENPFILITTMAMGVVILVSIGIAFILKGVKAVNEQSESSFTSINKMVRRFKAIDRKSVV